MLTEIKYGKHIQGEVIDFTMMECGGCGIPFFVPTKWRNAKVQSHGDFHCPNGCSRVFVAKTDAEKLKDELDKVKREEEINRQNLANKLLDSMNENTVLQKKLKRIHKGVCPCCNRSFQNLAAHMKTKHPELVKK